MALCLSTSGRSSLTNGQVSIELNSLLPVHRSRTGMCCSVNFALPERINIPSVASVSILMTKGSQMPCQVPHSGEQLQLTWSSETDSESHCPDSTRCFAPHQLGLRRHGRAQGADAAADAGQAAAEAVALQEVGADEGLILVRAPCHVNASGVSFIPVMTR